MDKVPVSDPCDEYGLNPTVFYRWQKEFFENGAAAFERRTDGRERKLQAKVPALTAKIAHRDEVIAEIMEAHIAPKTWGVLKASWVEPDVRELEGQAEVILAGREAKLAAAREAWRARCQDRGWILTDTEGAAIIGLAGASGGRESLIGLGCCPIQAEPRHPDILSHKEGNRIHTN